METAGKIQSLLDNRHEKISTDSNPYLGLDSIGRCSEERLDPQMLFDPLEEQFHLPTTAINICAGLGRDKEVVRKNHQALGSFGIVIPYPTQRIGIGQT